MEGNHGERHDFEAQWREWASRPPALTAEQAAAAIQERLHPRRAVRRSHWLLAAAAAMVVVAAGLALQVRRPPAPGRLLTESAITAPRLGPGEVLMWLDEETPLYMTFQLSNGDLTPGGNR